MITNDNEPNWKRRVLTGTLVFCCCLFCFFFALISRNILWGKEEE